MLYEEQVALAALVSEQGTWQTCVPSPVGVVSQKYLENLLMLQVVRCTVVPSGFALASLAFYQRLVRPTNLTIHCRSTSRTFQVCHCQGQGREPSSLEESKRNRCRKHG